MRPSVPCSSSRSTAASTIRSIVSGGLRCVRVFVGVTNGRRNVQLLYDVEVYSDTAG
ncbi:hypothetical protein [Micromonospora sp. NPDC005174]|uniref:hypothetical protein n=1 Tax=Micromonospora sp. NPDC005174 TaxID=3157018 RepID=UPI0033B8AE89